MRKTLVLTGVLLAVCAPSSWAFKNNVEGPIDGPQVTEWEALLQYDLQGNGPIASHGDTAWLGGSGLGNGTVVRGGLWNWEVINPEAGAEAPLFYPNGVPQGNEYRDGWKLEDRTARNGPSATGAGHWSLTGGYNFDNDNGAFAHRATTHAGLDLPPNSGPPPLDDPSTPAVSSWSIWVGTNLQLNPENCAWARRRGYGDGWSQGIRKSIDLTAADVGAVYSVEFYHRYATEAGFDTCFVEFSTNGNRYFHSEGGIYSGGDNLGPVGPANAVVTLLTIQAGQTDSLWIRFRLVSDAFFSDNNENGNFLYAWQLDDIQIRRNGSAVGTASSFEATVDGWQLVSFEGKDFQITNSLTMAAARIRPRSAYNASCPIAPPCDDACGLNNRVLCFTDELSCGLNNDFQDSYGTSPAFSIGGGDLEGDAGRLFRTDIHVDGGQTGAFETGPAICWVYTPANRNFCPFAPTAGNPGFGSSFNWSQTAFSSCDFFGMSARPICNDFIDNISADIPAAADSVILHIGGFSQCRSDPVCDTNDKGAPFYDNLRFGIFGTGPTLVAGESGRYSDNFPTTNTGFPLTATARSDGAHSFSQNLGPETPLRWVRADTSNASSSLPNASVHLRFRVRPGPCQPNLGHAFFTAYPPNQWHTARMDTGRAQGTGGKNQDTWMTCYHPSDPRNGTHWTGVPPALEPCDDILPDGLFTAGTEVDYFYELRSPPNGALVGTSPPQWNGTPITTDPSFSSLWREMSTLPELDPACDGAYENNLLVVYDFPRGLQSARLFGALKGLGIGFDVYDVMGTASGNNYNGIGRREDRPTQQPRPPFNGATDLMLDGYDCIWYAAGTLGVGSVTLSDQLTANSNGGQPSIDQQKLTTWIQGCQQVPSVIPRLLVMEGSGWAADVDRRTTNGQAFLTNFGVDVLTDDYAQDLAANDRRRCARIVGVNPASGNFDTGELLGSGCPDDISYSVLSATSSPGAVTEVVANFVSTGEDEDDDVNCADDVNQPPWQTVIRRTGTATAGSCARAVSMSFPFAFLYPLRCSVPAGQDCTLEVWVNNGQNATLMRDVLVFGGKTGLEPSPTGVEDPNAAPKLVNQLYQAEPNPANPSAKIRYSIAEKGRVSLKIFDVSGRLVRTLVEGVQEPTASGFEVVWDGKDDAGKTMGSGVFFYQIEAPGFMSSKKLVILK